METKELKMAFADNCGILKTSQLTALKIDSRKINSLINNGIIERITTGYYRLNSEVISEAAIISRLFADGILWLNTSLFYYGYSLRTPLEWDIIISKNASPTRFDLDCLPVKPFFVTPGRLTYGVTTVKIDDCTVKIFDRDRLICECLKYESELDKETFNQAIKAYIADPWKNIKNLLTYAKKRKVLNRVQDVIGVWL